MPSFVRVALVFVVTAAAVVAGVVLDDSSDLSRQREDPPAPSRAATPDGDTGSPSIPGDRREGRPSAFLPTFEPYDYLKAAPPRTATPLDGTYLRVVTIDDAGGPEHAIPMHCLRCVPYSVDAGVQTLTFFEGRFFLEHQIDGFRALGHFGVDGDQLRLFNDVNCSRVVGEYRWEVRGDHLSLDVVDDPCPYVDERPNDLTLAPWTQVDLCTSGVDDWYPAFLGC